MCMNLFPVECHDKGHLTIFIQFKSCGVLLSISTSIGLKPYQKMLAKAFCPKLLQNKGTVPQIISSLKSGHIDCEDIVKISIQLI